jgi:hypothetical protein
LITTQPPQPLNLAGIGPALAAPHLIPAKLQNGFADCRELQASDLSERNVLQMHHFSWLSSSVHLAHLRNAEWTALTADASALVVCILDDQTNLMEYGVPLAPSEGF